MIANYPNAGGGRGVTKLNAKSLSIHHTDALLTPCSANLAITQLQNEIPTLSLKLMDGELRGPPANGLFCSDLLLPRWCAQNKTLQSDRLGIPYLLK